MKAVVQRFFERRWIFVSVAVAIGLASLFLLRQKLEMAYYEYWLYPRTKAADGYIYPQLRYTVFDTVLVAWCIDGVIASVLSVRSAFVSRSLTGWTLRTLLLYPVLLAVLILDGIVMLVARRNGY